MTAFQETGQGLPKPLQGMQAAGSNTRLSSRAAPVNGMALPGKLASQDWHCSLAWLTSRGELVGQRCAGQGRLLRQGPGCPPLHAPSQPTLTRRTLGTHTALAPVHAPLLPTERPGASSAHLSLYTCVWRTAQDTCMNPGMLCDLSAGGSHSEVWKKCFTTVCNASREGCKLFKINHTLHNVQLSLLLLYFCTQ